MISLLYLLLSLFSYSYAEEEYEVISEPAIWSANIGACVSKFLSIDSYSYGVAGSSSISLSPCDSPAFGFYILGFGDIKKSFNFKDLFREDSSTDREIKLTNIHGLKSYGFFAQADVGLSICLEDLYYDTRHLNICASICGVYENAFPYSEYKVVDNWKHSTSEEVGVGIFINTYFKAYQGSLATCPYIGLWSQVWNKSTVSSYKTVGTDLHEKEIIIDRKKFRPIISCGFPIIIKISDSLGICASGSFFWSDRVESKGFTTLKSKSPILNDRIMFCATFGISKFIK